MARHDDKPRHIDGQVRDAAREDTRAMSKVTAAGMEVVTEKSGHQVTGMAASVCITPAAPSPLPIPYPTVGSSGEGIVDGTMRTRIHGAVHATVGSCAKACHGNEAGTLKEVVSHNTGGPSFLLLGAPTVLVEGGMAGITGSLAMMNKAPTGGGGGGASDAGDAGAGGSGGGGGGADAGGPGGPSGPGGEGGDGGGGSHDGAHGPDDASQPDPNQRAGGRSGPPAEHQCQGGHPVDLVTGAVVDEATDLELPGLVPLVFTRHYSSLRAGDAAASLGPGWAHGFEQRLELLETTTALRDGQGRWIYFDALGVGDASFHRGERLTLTRTGEHAYRVFAHDDRIARVFAPAEEGGSLVLQRIEDAYGNAMVLEHRGGQLARIVDTAGREVRVGWRGNRIASLLAVGGRTACVVRYHHDEGGRLVGVTNAVGATERYEYDARGRMSGTTTRTGTRFGYAYDGGSPRCTATGGPDHLFETRLERGPAERTTHAGGEEPRVVVWNDLGLAERLLLPDGTLLDEAAFDVDGLLVAQANGAGDGWQYWYDARGRRIRALDPRQQITAYEHDGDNLVRIVDPDGHETCFAYDEHGGLSQVVYPWGEQYVLRRDARGRLVEVMGNRGRVAAYDYDDAHNVIAETDARGARTTYDYDGLGRPIAMHDALGRATLVTYDAAGRRSSLRAPDGGTTTFGYDGAGHLTRIVDPLGRTTTHAYAGLHALARVVGPDGSTWRIEHTQEERVWRVINPLGQRYTFQRDDAGRVVVEKTFDGRELRYDRDAAGRVVRVVYPDGDARVLGYDRAGALLRDVTREDARQYQRDAQGRLMIATLESEGERRETRFERDAFGRLVGELQGDRRVRVALDELGQRTERVLPNGATTRYAYDALGALTGVEHDGFTLAYERDALGRETARSHRGGLRVASGYDLADRLVTQSASAPGADGGAPRALVERRYRYDRAGRVERIEDARWGATTYRYDVLDHLLETQRGARHEAFVYDTAGSILAALETFDGGPRQVVTHEPAPGNVLGRVGSTRYVHDKRGRRVRKTVLHAAGVADVAHATEYAWDLRDQLRAATLSDGTRVALAYDALGRRIRKEVTPGEGRRSRAIEYVWDGDVLALQLDSAAGARAFVHAPGSFVPLLQQERGEVLLVVVDHVGTVKELLTAEGRVAWSAAHSAWGAIADAYAEPSGSRRQGRPVSSPFRLLGQIADDELGLCFTRYRLFDPEVGRWISPDPLGLEGGPNLFAFGSAPSISVDPFGLSPTESGAGNPHLASVLAGHGPEQGFTGVYDRATGRIMLAPSGNPPLPPGWVPRRGGHEDVSEMLGGDPSQHAGFAAILQPEGGLELTWRSRSLNHTPDNMVPLEQRPTIVNAVQQATGRPVVAF